MTTATAPETDRPCGDADILALPLKKGGHSGNGAFNGECCLVEKLEDASDHPLASANSDAWILKARDTGAVLCVENPHPETDHDDDTGSPFAVYTFDSLSILEGGAWRPVTEEELDDYSDDVRAFIRASSDVFL